MISSNMSWSWTGKKLLIPVINGFYMVWWRKTGTFTLEFKNFSNSIEKKNGVCVMIFKKFIMFFMKKRGEFFLKKRVKNEKLKNSIEIGTKAKPTSIEYRIE